MEIFQKMRVAMVLCGPGLACPMRFWQVPRGVTKPRGHCDANTARGARWGIFWLEWQILQMRPPLGENGDFHENKGGRDSLRSRLSWSNVVLAGPTELNEAKRA